MTETNTKPAESFFAEDVQATYAAVAALVVSKNKDYGPQAISGAPGGPLHGVAVRIWDKACRLAHLITTGADAQHESIRDTLTDLMGYGGIGVMIVDGEWPGTETQD